MTRSTIGATSEEPGVGLVTTLGIGDRRADVAGAMVAVGRHRDEPGGPQWPPGGELVLGEQLARQVEQPWRARGRVSLAVPGMVAAGQREAGGRAVSSSSYETERTMVSLTSQAGEPGLLLAQEEGRGRAGAHFWVAR